MCSLQGQGLPRSNSGTHDGSEVEPGKGASQLFPFPTLSLQTPPVLGGAEARGCEQWGHSLFPALGGW